jgi:hypothetical protein
MIVSAWRMWGLGLAWVLGLSVGLGVLVGGTFGFVVGLSVEADALGSAVLAGLGLAVLGAVYGGIYGAILGVPTGTVATGLFAWVARRQLRSGPLAPAALRVQAALIAGLVQAATALVLLGQNPSLVVMGYVIPPILVATGAAALIGPKIVRKVGGREALVTRPDATVRTPGAAPID